MASKGSAAAVTVSVSLAVLMALSSSSCLVRRRSITRRGAAPTQTLLTADKDTLIRKIASEYAAIQSLNATCDMVPALGTVNKGKVTEYKDVRAYILFRKPNEIRLLGLYPVVRNKAFDMVSDGLRFKLFLPSKNRFIEGPNEIATPSPSKLENLRPQHFLEALLVRPFDPGSEQAILENFTDEENAAYLLSFIKQNAGSQPVLDRQLWFDRLKLQLVRQLIFDSNGDILTDARYSDWRDYDRVPFPKQIEINRPKDEYGVVITVVKMDINVPLKDDQFVLARPEGTQLRIVGAPPSESSDSAPAPSKKGNGKK